jgi:hypothetical protein
MNIPHNNFTLAKPSALCAVCGVRPRGAGGKLTRCLDCLKADVDLDRRRREARAKKAVAAVAIPHIPLMPGRPFHLLFADKVCETCRETKPLEAYAPHNGARDGRRSHCKVCCSSDRYRPQIEGPEARARRNVRQSRPEWRRSHRRSLKMWAERNPQAAEATRIAARALKAGKIEKAAHCQALGCTSTKHIELHHNYYSRPLEILAVCASHHRLGHSIGYIEVAPGLPPHLGNIPARA